MGSIATLYLFHLHQQSKCESKIKFRQASNHCERVSEVARFAYANKTKGSITSQEIGSCNICRIANRLSTKVNLLCYLYSTAWKFCLLYVIKQNFLLKTFMGTLILITQLSLNLFFPLELIWNCIFLSPLSQLKRS